MNFKIVPVAGEDVVDGVAPCVDAKAKCVKHWQWCYQKVCLDVYNAAQRALVVHWSDSIVMP